MKWFPVVVLLLGSVAVSYAFLSKNSSQSTIYVSPDGKNGEGCGSSASPCATLSGREIVRNTILNFRANLSDQLTWCRGPDGGCQWRLNTPGQRNIHGKQL